MDVYDMMTYAELHTALIAELGEVKRGAAGRALHTRTKVLPMLAAMKRKTAKPGRRKATGEVDWQEECYRLDINPALVRKAVTEHREAEAEKYALEIIEREGKDNLSGL